MFNNKKKLQLSLIMSGLLLPATLFAQSSYMFPSDITDPSEQTKVDAERSQRYESERKWVYPDEENISRQRQYSESQNSYENFDNGSEYPRSEHYKYDDFSNRNSSEADYRDAQDRHTYTERQFQPSQSHFDNSQSRYQSEPPFQSESRYQSEQRYQSERSHQPNRSHQRGSNSHQRGSNSRQRDNNSYQRDNNSYQQDNNDRQFDNRYQSDNSYFPQTSGAIYVSDLIKKPEGQAKRFFPEKGDIGQYRARAKQPFNRTINKFEKATDQVQSQIRYIPVPVYTYALPPGTLPGTVPGIVTPPNMVPGYSHLSPSYGSYNSSPYSLYSLPGTGGVPVVNPYATMLPDYGGNYYGLSNGSVFPYNPANTPVNSLPGFSNMPGIFP